MWHRIRLSNGRTLLLREDEDALTLALQDDRTDDLEAYLATICLGHVDVYHYAGDAADALVRGLQATPGPLPQPATASAPLWVYDEPGTCIVLAGGDREQAIDAIIESRGGDKHSADERLRINRHLSTYDCGPDPSGARRFTHVSHRSVVDRDKLVQASNDALAAVQRLYLTGLGKVP